MSSTVFAYSLDPTGQHPANRVEGEIHTLAPKRVRAIVPRFGPYYTGSLVVYDHETGQQLIRQTQYRCAELLQDATINYGQELCALILIIDPSVSATVRIDYQVLGGLYQNDVTVLANLYEAVIHDDRPVDWQNVQDKPIAYPPTLHRHVLSDVYGWEPIVSALERLRSAVVLGNVPAFEALLDWVDEKLQSYRVELTARLEGVEHHISSTTNPHAVTAAQVGLDAVRNLPIVTLDEVTRGEPVDKYLTHAMFIAAIAAMGGIGGGSGGGTTTHTLTATVDRVDEGQVVTITVTTAGLTDGTILFWTLVHLGTTAEDFDAASGSVLIRSNRGQFTITALLDRVLETDEGFAVQLRQDSVDGKVIGLSTLITVHDVVPPRIVEWVPAMTIGLTSPYLTGRVDPTSLFLAQATTVPSASAAVSRDRARMIDKVPHRFIRDTTPPPAHTYALTADPLIVDEGGYYTLQVTTTGYSGTTALYWRVIHDSTTAADFEAVQGVVQIHDNAGLILVNTAYDGTSSADKTCRIAVYTEASYLTEVSRTAPLTIRNVVVPVPVYSVIPEHWTYETATTMQIVLTVTTQHTSDRSYSWQCVGVNVSDAAFAVGTGSVATVGGQATITVTLASSIRVTDTAEFYVELRSGTTILTVSNIITVLSHLPLIVDKSPAITLAADSFFSPAVTPNAKSYYWAGNVGGRMTHEGGLAVPIVPITPIAPSDAVYSACCLYSPDMVPSAASYFIVGRVGLRYMA